VANLLPIRDFIETRPLPDTVVVLGKGPSLDHYDAGIDPLGAYVLGINEAALAFRCDGVAYVDLNLATLPWRLLNSDIDIFCPVTQPYQGEGSAYQYVCDARGEKWPKRMWIPTIGHGTASRALTIMGEWGVRKMILWGFDRVRWLTRPTDGGAMHATCLRSVVVGTATERDYKSINRGVLDILTHYGIQATFMHDKVSNGQLCNC